MSLMAESGCLEQVDRGAGNPTPYYHQTRKGGQSPVWAVAPLIIIGPTYKVTTGKLSVQYALFTNVSNYNLWFFNFECSN
jgi:hypothetical protein